MEKSHRNQDKNLCHCFNIINVNVNHVNDINLKQEYCQINRNLNNLFILQHLFLLFDMFLVPAFFL